MSEFWGVEEFFERVQKALFRVASRPEVSDHPYFRDLPLEWVCRLLQELGTPEQVVGEYRRGITYWAVYHINRQLKEKSEILRKDAERFLSAPEVQAALAKRDDFYTFPESPEDSENKS